jgi:hypothetical protein
LLWIDTVFARSASFGSGRFPCSTAATSARWEGTIVAPTLAAMIVPSIAPTWMNAARPLSRCVSVMTIATSAMIDSTAAVTRERGATMFQSRSYSIRPPTIAPTPTATALPALSVDSDGSTISARPPT